jgi:hypothetical protein
MIENSRKNLETKKIAAGEDGFVLVFSLVMLVVITLLGVWALNTSTLETMISGNQQRFDENFNIAEGGVMAESGKLGYADAANFSWYTVVDPSVLNQVLAPGFGSGTYDPGGDLTPANTPATIGAITPGNFTNWPMENLLHNYTAGDTQMDYSYLVTYLFPDTPPKGYDASLFSSYKFRINGHRNNDVEVGGIKVGVKIAI